MFFFQTTLLIGYFLAHIFSKTPPKINALLIIACLALGTVFLPLHFIPPDNAEITGKMIFIQLMLSVGAPFIALSTLTPSLQRFFSYGHHATAEDPYYMYAASNIGSFIGLFSYPLIIEMFFGLGSQSFFWGAVYIAVIVLVCLCILGVLILKAPASKDKKVTSKLKTHITNKQKLNWLMLAAIPSSLMLGTTLEITTDISPAPMVWVIPLGLYLITTIMAFSKKSFGLTMDKLSTLHLLGVTVILSLLAFSLFFSQEHRSLLLALVYLAVFFITALFFHKRLADSRPSKEHLTEFYLIMSLGGAIGGGFNAFIAPLIFSDIYEFYIVLTLSLLLNPVIKETVHKKLSKITTACLGLCLLLYAGYAFDLALLENPLLLQLSIFLLLIAFLCLMMSPKKLFFAMVCLLILAQANKGRDNVIHKERNFFGVITVTEQKMRIKNKNETTTSTLRMLKHGTTAHGLRPLDSPLTNKPHGYYSEHGPLGDLLNNQNHTKKIGVVGMGIAQTACYTAPNREFIFYEIDPDIVSVAEEFFPYQKKCPIKNIILGDARLNLENTTQQFDALIIDAFSSDSVPLHLLTKEALDIYFKNIKPNGYILFHISNRYLNLSTPLAALAHNNNAFALKKYYTATTDHLFTFSSRWLVITKNKKVKQNLEKQNWDSIESTQKPWTDDFSNILKYFIIFNKK